MHTIPAYVPAEGEPDPHLPEFSKNQLDIVRQLYAEALMTYALPVRDAGGALVGTDDESLVLGLESVARACVAAGTDARQWVPLINEYAANGAAVVRDRRSPAELPEEELHARLLPRLVRRVVLEDHDGLGDAPTFAYSRPFSDDLVTVLVLDGPSSATMLDDGFVGDRDAQAMWGVAFRNLRHLEPMTSTPVATADGMPDISMLEGDTFHTASATLDLRANLMRSRIPVDERMGVIFGIPARYRAFYFVPAVGHPKHNENGLRAVAAHTLAEYRDTNGPVSPNVYWLEGHQPMQVASWNADGHLELAAPESLTALLRE